jgi:hypothetical protein
MEIKILINHDTFILGQEFRNDELIIPVKHVLKTKQSATGKLEKLKDCLVAHGNMKKRKIKKSQQHFKNKNNNKDKRMLKTTLQEPARRQTLYQFRSLNLSKTHGHPVHLQEGSNFFFYASFSLSTKCTMLAAMMLPNMNSQTLSKSVLM